MTRIKVLGPLVVLILTAVAVLVMGACGNGEPAPTPALVAPKVSPPAATTAPPQLTPTPTAAPTAIAVAAATETPVAPTATPVPPTAAPTLPARYASPVPTATPTPVSTVGPTSTPIPVQFTNVEEFGFSWRLDGPVDVENGGWTEVEPSNVQGQINFVSGGVSAILIWSPAGERVALDYLVETYNILRRSQADLTFSAVSEDELTVSGEPGVFGGFTTSDASGAVIGGGLVGVWACPGPETAYRLSVNGVDARVVQIRFDRLVDNFTCSS